MTIPRYADLSNLTVHELTELCRLYNRLDPESKKAKAIRGRLNSVAFVLSENGFLGMLYRVPDEDPDEHELEGTSRVIPWPMK